MNTFMAKRISLNTVSYIILICMAITCLFPLFWMLSSSLKTQDQIFTDMSLIPKHPHWSNYVDAWTKGDFNIYFLNSLIYTACSVIGILFISSLAAYAFARLDFPMKNFFYLLLIVTLMIPIPGAFIPLYVLLNKLGLLNTRAGLILCYINGGLAFGIFILRNFFEYLPKDIEDAAKIDGASKFGIYWRIALPMARPALATLVIFNVLGVWNEFLLALVVLQDKSKMPIQRGLMVFQGTHITDYPLLMAGITIATIPVVITYIIMQRHIIKGITAGALKQ